MVFFAKYIEVGSDNRISPRTLHTSRYLIVGVPKVEITYNLIMRSGEGLSRRVVKREGMTSYYS